MKKFFKIYLPWELLLPLLALTALSLLFIHSASYSPSLGVTLPYAKRQAVHLVVAFCAFLLVASRSLEESQNTAYLWYGIGIFLLLAVFFLGRSAKGATRWISFGGVRLQPSEVMKICYLLGISAYLSHWRFQNLKSLFLPLLLTFVPMGLVLKQPDLGTSLLFLPLLFSLLYLRGVSLRCLLGLCGCFLGLALLVWNLDLLNPYQKRRIYAFFNPERYAKTIAYQQIQSQIAIGAGGIFGKGLFQGTQTQLGYLPERHTDFIFSVICEEWGFVGGSFVLSLLCILALACLSIGQKCQDDFGKLLAAGIGVLLGLQSFVNVGIALGILPVTGLTLPFVSYGGSSTFSFWIGLGLVAQVAKENKNTLA